MVVAATTRKAIRTMEFRIAWNLTHPQFHRTRDACSYSYGSNCPDLVADFGGWRGELRLAGAVTWRAGERRMAVGCGGVYLRSLVPLLQPVHRQQDLRSRSSSPDAGDAIEQWTRFHSDEPVGRFRPSLRRDCRAWSAGRTDARCSVRIPPRRALDNRRRRAGWGRSGLRDPMRVRT